MADRYLIGFVRLRDAETRTMLEALRRGCFSDPEHDVTRFWWATLAHPNPGRPEVALVIAEGSEGGLDMEEQSDLIDEETARAGGWLVDIESEVGDAPLTMVAKIKRTFSRWFA